MQAKRVLSVAIDGSKRSNYAFQVFILYKAASQFFDHTTYFDQIAVIHVFNPDKTYLSHKYKPDVLRQNTKNSLLSKYQSNKYSLHFEKVKTSTKQDALAIAKQIHSHLITVGYNGRKGQNSDITILGSVVSNATFSYIPLMIVKDFVKRQDTKQKGYNLAVCVDGSNKSFSGLRFAKLIVNKDMDKIFILYCPHFSKPQQFNVKLQQKIKQHMDGWQNWKYCRIKTAEDTAEQLLEYINEDPSYVFHYGVFGNNGQRAQKQGKSFLGKTSQKFLHKMDSNIIFIPQ